ncbi:hypothetical protein [Alkanindiges illinoisensis]|uniref:Uncharacterized protein n=1 Tax=Alkanindiges illinoisensis TaxID=197183 RepID=A0A4Y7X8V9_9GAMM|nr:hypothetical protein [Alkanindiges illinoisensis]TEU23345.1 hypothetical protein E2B99_13585 [Alkanindiges illinoisensis]
MSAMQEFVTKSEQAPAVTPVPSLNELDKMTPQLGNSTHREKFADWALSFVGLLMLVFIIVSFFQYLIASASGV